MIIPENHREFIRLVANGVTFEKAYVTICNKSITSGNARARGSRLAKKYASEIAHEHKKVSDIVEAQRDSEVVKQAISGILSISEVDRKLCEIITNETSSEMAKLKAIDTYYKRFGANEPIKTETTLKGEVNIPRSKFDDSKE